ncbi:MAG TPA: DUF5666 domain-containing protein [Vicinamibacterales bacterium]
MSKVAASSAAGVTVTIAGTSISTTADASGSFTLTGVPPIQIVLTFSGPGVDATLPIGAVGSSDYVQINVTITGSTATLNTQQTTSPDSTASLEGYIEAIDLTARIVKVSGISIEVPTNAALTRGGSAIALSDLKTTDRVHVTGVKDGSMIRASEIVALNIAPPTPPPATVTFSGTVSSLTGTCPSLAFTANNTGVHTTSSTTFGGASCADIRNGGSVGVAGTKQSDGSVLASYVSVSVPQPTATATVIGNVSSLSGTCPSIAFSVNGTTVRTNSSSKFNGKSCGQIANGDSIGVAGTKQSDGSILATQVETAAVSAPPVTVSFSGAVASVSGTCPSLVLTVSGTVVDTNGATSFGGKTCSTIAAGDIVGGSGTKQSDGSVIATSITSASPTATVTFNAVITSLSGTCPSLVLTVGGKQVHTSASTIFGGASCSGIASGDMLGVAGTTQSDGSILASYVSDSK